MIQLSALKYNPMRRLPLDIMHIAHISDVCKQLQSSSLYAPCIISIHEFIVSLFVRVIMERTLYVTISGGDDRFLSFVDSWGAVLEICETLCVVTQKILLSAA